MLRKWLSCCLTGLLIFFVTLTFAQGALATGPFSHILFARQLWPKAAASVGLDPQRTDLLPALYAGAIAPDAPYYPGAESRLATLVHEVRPFDVCQALLDMAQTPQEKAFALGWVSHALLDVGGHGELVNRLAKGPYNQNRLLHKQIEWGLDCWILMQPEYAWLWDPQVEAKAGLSLWARALQKAYGGNVPESMLLTAQHSELKTIGELPYAWWWTGRLERPGHGVINFLGWLIGETLRPAYVSWLTWRDKDLDVRAVLSPRKAEPQDAKDLLSIMKQEEGNLLKNLAGAPWPTVSLDVDPSCGNEGCKDGREALEWLRSRGSKDAAPDKI